MWLNITETIGVPVPNTDIRIIKDDGSEAKLGELRRVVSER